LLIATRSIGPHCWLGRLGRLQRGARSEYPLGRALCIPRLTSVWRRLVSRETTGASPVDPNEKLAAAGAPDVALPQGTCLRPMTGSDQATFRNSTVTFLRRSGHHHHLYAWDCHGASGSKHL